MVDQILVKTVIIVGIRWDWEFLNVRPTSFLWVSDKNWTTGNIDIRRVHFLLPVRLLSLHWYHELQSHRNIDQKRYPLNNARYTNRNEQFSVRADNNNSLFDPIQSDILQYGIMYFMSTYSENYQLCPHYFVVLTII